MSGLELLNPELISTFVAGVSINFHQPTNNVLSERYLFNYRFIIELVVSRGVELDHITEVFLMFYPPHLQSSITVNIFIPL